MTEMSTLCYIQRGHEYLMLHRVVKKNDVNKDKWIGVGGHFEAEESPEEPERVEFVWPFWSWLLSLFGL